MRTPLCLIGFFLVHILLGQDPKQIEIIRDTFGVPHIYAPTDAGVAYGLAWAHSEDDFKTMQLTLLAAKQMLGQHLGKDGAKADYVTALLRCDKVVEQEWDSLSDDYKEVITGYTNGINAYAKRYPKEVLVEDAFPVTVKEVLSAYVLSLSVISGVDRVIGNLVAGRVEEAQKPKGNGSNAFAFSRRKTTDEYVYLNVNSHQPLEGPTAWYEAHLVSDEGWNALGGLFPGAATIFHGTNEDLGWAHTVNYPDKIDVYQLEMHPEYPLKYKFDNEWKTLDLKEVKLSVRILFGIKIRVKREVYRSVYGPVIKNNKGFFAFNLGTLHDLRAPEQWYRMNKATNWEEFREALAMVAIPGFNIVYADREDNIYYLGNGKIPIRDPNYDWSGTLPGDTSATLWNSFHPLVDLPQVLNPKSGYVFNTNNGAFNATAEPDNVDQNDYDPTMGYREFENNRSTRFVELVSRYDSVSWEDFLKIKYDDSLPNELAYPVDLDPLWELDSMENMKYASLIKVLHTWDRTAHFKSKGAAQFMILYRFLVEQHRSKYTGVPYPLTEEEAWEAIAYTHRYLKKYFSRIDITLGDYQLLVRGDFEVPVSGIIDVITAMDAEPYKHGRTQAVQGESYIMLVRYPEEGLPIIETINVFGASNHPESPHYKDQMLMFLKQQRKRMTLDIEKVRENAEAVYHPG